MKNSDRLQTLGVLLLAVFGWLVFDLGAVKARVFTYLEAHAGSAAASVAEEPAPRAPTLIGHPGARPATVLASSGGGGGCGGCRPSPASVLIDARQDAEVVITSIFPDRKLRLNNFTALAGVLRLSEIQQRELEQILEDAKREFDDLRHQQDEDGRSWHHVVASVDRTGWSAHHRLSIALRDFIDTPLRGVADTYRIERARIIVRYAAALRVQLDPEQQYDFDKFDVSRVIDSDGRWYVYENKRVGAMRKKLAQASSRLG